MKKKVSKSLIISVAILAVVMVAVGFALFKITTTVADLRETVVSENSADVVLASAGVEDESVVSVPILYFDQKMDECVNLYDLKTRDALEERQFEWSSCEYRNKKLEQGIVDFYLGDDYLPVAKGGSLTPNKGVKGNNFKRWFNQVEGLSKSYSGTLQLVYHNKEIKFDYNSDSFYPLEEAEFSKGDSVNNDGKNYLFTLNLGVPFRVLASGEEAFEIIADDDTFVYVGDKLVVDMGGIHGATKGEFSITKEGEIYGAVNGEELAYSGVKVDKNSDSIIRIFHADRDSSESVFKISFLKMNLNVTNTSIASNKSSEDGLQVAYDPSNPSYVAPLGESSVSKPQRGGSILSLVIIQCLLLGVLLVFSVAVIRVVMKQIKR